MENYKFDMSHYGAEVKERWGNTSAFKQSKSKTANYTLEDWTKMAMESDAIIETLKILMTNGFKPESAEAKETAEAHRVHISKWFYDCSLEIHTGLAEMYLSDERFKDNYEKYAQGLAQYLHDAILANSMEKI